MWRFTEEADGGSDQQLQYLQAFLRFATKDELDIVKGLFDGSRTLEGREIDTDLRWEIVAALASLGAMDAAGVDEVLATDDTQNGRKAALTAKAAIPTAEAKRDAWEKTVGRDELANESITAVTVGFTRSSEDLLEPYTVPYFDMLNEVWKSRSSEIANRLIKGYFPGVYPHQSVVDRADSWLAENIEAVYGLRRPIMEGRDDAARALRVQEADVEG